MQRRPSSVLVARWRSLEHGAGRGGRAAATRRVEVENAGTAPWRTRGAGGRSLPRVPLARRARQPDRLGRRAHAARARRRAGRDAAAVESRSAAPIPPGPYRLAFDLVEEHRFWLAELGNAPLERGRRRAPRIERRTRVAARPGALDAQDERPREPRRPGSRRASTAPTGRALLDAHGGLRAPSAARSRSRAVRASAARSRRSRRRRRAAAATRASPHPLALPVARCRRSSRTAEVRRACRRSSRRDGDEPCALRRPDRASDFDRDLVVDAREDARAERERDARTRRTR